MKCGTRTVLFIELVQILLLIIYTKKDEYIGSNTALFPQQDSDEVLIYVYPLVPTMETHEEYSNLYQDEHMMDNGPETRYLSPSSRSGLANRDQRVLAEYEDGDWLIEAQVSVDGEWYVSARSCLENIPDGSKEYTALGNPVRKNYGMFSGLSRMRRFIFAPIYAFDMAYRCVKGQDINIQVLDEDSVQD